MSAGSCQARPSPSRSVHGAGRASWAAKCRVSAPALSSAPTRAGIGCPVRAREEARARRAASTNSRVRAVAGPAAARVFSTGARTGGGAGNVRPGRRWRDCVPRRRRSSSHMDPARTGPPDSPAISHDDGTWVVSASPPTAWASCTGMDSRMPRGVAAVAGGRGGVSWRAASPPRPGPGVGGGGATRGVPRGIAGATPAVSDAVSDAGSAAGPVCWVGMVRVQPMSMTSGSDRWTPPGCSMRRDAS